MVVILVAEEALKLVEVRPITTEGVHTPPLFLFKEVKESLEGLLRGD